MRTVSRAGKGKAGLLCFTALLERKARIETRGGARFLFAYIEWHTIGRICVETGSQFASYPSLRERVVVITGGANGIVEAMVAAFWAQGSRVVFLDLQQGAGEALVQRMSLGLTGYA